MLAVPLYPLLGVGSAARLAGAAGRLPRRAASCGVPPPQQKCGAASRRTVSASAHAAEMARDGVPPIVIQRQLGHSDFGITTLYLQGIGGGEIIETVHARRASMIPVSASLRL